MNHESKIVDLMIISVLAAGVLAAPSYPEGPRPPNCTSAGRR